MWLKCEWPWIHSSSPWWHVVQYPIDVAVFPLIYSILLHPLEFSVSVLGHNLEAVDRAFTMLLLVWSQYVLPGEVWSLLMSYQNYKCAHALTQQFNLQKLCPIFSHSIYEWKITLAPVVYYLFIFLAMLSGMWNHSSLTRESKLYPLQWKHGALTVGLPVYSL